MSNPPRKKPQQGGIFLKLCQLFHDRRGLGGIEFALLAPVLLALYITVFELTIGFSVAKRATRATGTIADLVTQQKSVSKTYLKTMPDVVASLFVPYGVPYDKNNPEKTMHLKITGVTIDAAKNPTVLWSWDEKDGKPYAAGSAVNVPTDMRTPNSFLVHAEISVPHQLLMFMPDLLPSTVSNVTIRRDFFYRQRLGDNIPCSDC